MKDLGSHYPPLYPMVLAICSATGSEVLTVARWVQIVIYWSNILIFGYILFETTEKAILPTIIGCSILASSQLFLEIHAIAWSEPLFLIFLYWVCIHYRFIKRKFSLIYLLWSMFFFGLALVTRYAGIAFIIAGILSVLLLNKLNWQKRFLHSILFSAVSLAPFLLWIIRNISSDRLATNREFGFHPVPVEVIKQGIGEVLSWFQLPFNPAYMVIFVLLCAVVIFTIILSHKVCGRPTDGNIPETCFIIVIVYIIFIVFSISFLDSIIPLDRRILSPVHFLDC